MRNNLEAIFTGVLIIGFISVLQFWVRTNSIEVTCVPLSAISYDGSTNTWEDYAGNVVLYSPEEDTYEWCEK